MGKRTIQILSGLGAQLAEDPQGSINASNSHTFKIENLATQKKATVTILMKNLGTGGGSFTFKGWGFDIKDAKKVDGVPVLDRYGNTVTIAAPGSGGNFTFMFEFVDPLYRTIEAEYTPGTENNGNLEMWVMAYEN